MNHEFSVYDPNDKGPSKYGPRRLYKGGGGGSSTTTPTIPNELKPLANLYTQQATQVANTPYQAYQGQRYADLNGTQNQALQMIQNRAANGSQTMSNAENNLNQVISGGNTNPYLDQMVNKAQQNVINNYQNATVGSGSFGNSGLQEQLAKGLGDVSSQMYGQAYNTDQANRLSAISMAPTFGNSAYNDASQLLNAGNIQQNQAQNNLDFGYQQFQDKLNYPFKQLQAMGGVLGQNMGSTTVQKGGGK